MLGTTSVSVGSTIAIETGAYDEHHFLVAVDAAGAPTGQPLPDDHGMVPIERAHDMNVFLSEADASRIMLSPNCRDQLTSFVTANDGGAPDAGVPTPSSKGGCSIAPITSGDFVIFAMALLALRRARRR